MSGERLKKKFGRNAAIAAALIAASGAGIAGAAYVYDSFTTPEDPTPVDAEAKRLLGEATYRIAIQAEDSDDIEGMCTGVVLDGGYLLTARHCFVESPQVKHEVNLARTLNATPNAFIYKPDQTVIGYDPDGTTVSRQILARVGEVVALGDADVVLATLVPEPGKALREFSPTGYLQGARPPEGQEFYMASFNGKFGEAAALKQGKLVANGVERGLTVMNIDSEGTDLLVEPGDSGSGVIDGEGAFGVLNGNSVRTYLGASLVGERTNFDDAYGLNRAIVTMVTPEMLAQGLAELG